MRSVPRNVVFYYSRAAYCCVRRRLCRRCRTGTVLLLELFFALESTVFTGVSMTCTKATMDCIP